MFVATGFFVVFVFMLLVEVFWSWHELRAAQKISDSAIEGWKSAIQNWEKASFQWDFPEPPEISEDG
jgi:hypothetical protein